MNVAIYLRSVAVALAAITLCALPLRAAAQASATDVARHARHLLDQAFAADVPGAAVLVARGDEVLFRGARGTADMTTGRPLTPDDRFQIASLTKQMVAAGVLKLVEAGKVSLGEPLSRYVQGLPHGDRIAVAQLLNHTSGIRNFPGAPEVMHAKLPQDASTDQLIDAFKGQPPESAPGDRWAYNDFGYVLAGKIIETASGKPWHVYLAETFFQPLGMTRTCYCADPAIAGHVMDAGEARRVPPTNITWEHAAGALVSSVDDLLKWNRALHEGRILAPEQYLQMVTPHGRAGEGGMHYGFGIDHTPLHGLEQLSHSGYVDGFTSHLIYMPGPDLTVVVLRNSSGRGDAPAEVARRLAAAAIGVSAP